MVVSSVMVYVVARFGIDDYWVAGALFWTALIAAFLPKSQKAAGVTPRPRRVEVTNPPTMTTATGLRISLPGASAG
jgi:hypothetical protein